MYDYNILSQLKCHKKIDQQFRNNQQIEKKRQVKFLISTHLGQSHADQNCTKVNYKKVSFVIKISLPRGQIRLLFPSGVSGATLIISSLTFSSSSRTLFISFSQRNLCKGVLLTKYTTCRKTIGSKYK